MHRPPIRSKHFELDSADPGRRCGFDGPRQQLRTNTFAPTIGRQTDAKYPNVAKAFERAASDVAPADHRATINRHELYAAIADNVPGEGSDLLHRKAVKSGQIPSFPSDRGDNRTQTLDMSLGGSFETD